jgi:tetratricopeptide (TPR) repeat protein
MALNAKEDKPLFSTSALQYLLDRKEYDRFDWYIGCFLAHYPDTAVLHLMKGHRYYLEAMETRSHDVTYIINRTGGIPRKYNKSLIESKLFGANQVQTVFNDSLLDKAFASMRYARSLEPGREDIAMGICRMASETGRSDILAKEVTLYTSAFGYTQEIEKTIFDYVDRNWVMAADSSMILLLRNLTAYHPDEAKSYLLLSNYYFLSGNVDSAFAHARNALNCDRTNLYFHQKAITLAAIKCDFKEATELALRKYEVSKELLDLEQAAICAYAYDRFRGMFLYTKILKSESTRDSATISRWLFDEFIPNNNRLQQKNLFSGNLFHLNFPLFYITYRQDLDQIDYYHNMAGALFISGLYDSAAYYNLKLITSMGKNHPLGYKALYNLAAEYFATGRYLISFQLFLWIYRYLGGWRDFSVIYALGVNYEQFGDFYHAKEQYTEIVNFRGKMSEENKNLRELAALRLNSLRGKRMITQ